MRVGILGGGQLARMLALAGIPAGLEFVIVDPKADACAGGLGEHVVGGFDDRDALDRLKSCDRVTCDFENVPADSLEYLHGAVEVRPNAGALAAAQDRLTEKHLFVELGLDTPAFAPVSSRPELAAAVEQVGLPAVLKTRRLGYDGKGQAVLRDGEDLEGAWQRLGGRELLLEAWVDFDCECAVTAVRAADGEIRVYPLTRTVHRNGILALAAAPLDAPELTRAAAHAVSRLLEKLDYIGCLSLELFVRNGELLANEFAPRVHNSAHWTIEGTASSQFDNHLRAVCDRPLGAVAARGRSLMVNFIGALPDAGALLAIPGLAFHDYRKAARPGRKVGHATLWAPDADAMDSGLQALRQVLPDQLPSAAETLWSAPLA